MMVLCEETLSKLHFWRNICAAQKNTNFPSLYQCIDNLGPVISVWKQVSDWSIAQMKPSHWSLPSDHGTHLTVLLPQPTLLSCHKFEQFQYLAENRNKANHCWFCWAWKLPYNDNLIQSENITSWVGPKLFKVLLRWHAPPSPLVSYEDVSGLSA